MADKNIELAEKIYSKMAGVINVGSNPLTPGKSFLVLSSPGIFLDPEFDLTDINNEALWSNLLNRIPEPNFIYGDSGQSMNSLMDTILIGKELPEIELTPTQKKVLAEQEAVLMDSKGDPTPAFTKFLFYQDAYYTALSADNAARENAQNSGTPIPPSVTAALKKAKQNWDVLGFKGKVEKAISTVANLSDLDPNNWWYKLRQRFDKYQVDAPAGEFAKTNTFPEYSKIFSDTGWTSFTFSQEDYENQETSKSVDSGGGASVNYGLWRVSTEASYKKDEGFSKTQAEKIQISVDLKRVQINRPWLEPLIFRSRAWRFAQGSALGESISNGLDATEGHTPTGVMPLFPTTLLIAKNLEVKADFSNEEIAWFEQQIETKASVGFGPFSINGHYNQTDKDKTTKGNVTGNGISNADPQILGWMCNVLNRCPNPDPSLPWPSKMELMHLGEYSEAHVEKLRTLHQNKFVTTKK